MSTTSPAPAASTPRLPAAPGSAPRAGATRDAAIDHLRIVLTALVILHHTAIAYGGSGGWYWREQPNASNQLLVMFNATNQSFFMGFFFLLAGYYTPTAFERKGPGRFFADRGLRLGVPLLVFFFLLHPLTVALGRMSEGFGFWSGWAQMIRAGVFGPGPLWFAEALLLFALGYFAWRRFRPTPASAAALPGFGALLVTALLLGAISFILRLAIPVGQNVLWLQLGYFPCYVYLFAAGCAASRARLLEKVTFAQARPWLIVSAVAFLTLPVVMVLRGARGGFEGGWNSNAFFYALWDPLLAWGVLLGSLWAARAFWSRATSLTAFLARNAYGAFIVHPPFVVGFGLLAASWSLAPLAKFAVVGAAACAASFLAGDLLRRLPGAARIL